jgi:hypothetical protein
VCRRTIRCARSARSVQAPGAPWEDPTKGFTFGGWVMPYFNAVFG